MTIYVRRGERLVNKKTGEPMTFDPMKVCAARFPTPRVGRMESYQSPIDGKEITSWRQRDREMTEHDCFDPRDFNPGHVYRRGREVQFEEVRANAERTGSDDTDTWRDPE